MPQPNWKTIVDQLASEHSVAFDDPLTDQEIADVERCFEFRFPLDLKAFLQTGLPVSDRFPNWRADSKDALRDRLQRPLEGILFDVDCNRFWLPEWGSRPDDLEDAFTRVRQLVAAAPKLIPVYSHRMMPDSPHIAGNPVFSVHQTDIICYGVDLADYFVHEFVDDKSDPNYVWPSRDTYRKIEFWDLRRFQDVRWDENGMARFDNRRGILPTGQQANDAHKPEFCDLVDENGAVIDWRDAAFAVVVAINWNQDRHQIERVQTLAGYQAKPGTARIETTREDVVKMVKDGKRLITAVFNVANQHWERGPVVQLTDAGFLQTELSGKPETALMKSV